MSTGKQLAKKHRPNAGPEDWGRWSAHLAKRKSPRDPWRRIASKASWPLNWALDHIDAAEATRDLVSHLGRWAENPKKSRTSQVVKRLEAWLADSESRRDESAFGLEILAWSYVLPRLAATLPAAPWCEVLDYLTQAATQWPDLSLQRQPLAHQWLAGELPLTLAYQFPELPACSGLRAPAAEALSAGLHGLLDGNGLPSARNLRLVRPLLACWTRCRALAADDKRPVFDDEAQSNFEWFVRRALQLTRETGSPVFSRVAFGPNDLELFEVAVQLVGNEDDAAIADQILPGRSAQRRKSQKLVFFPEAGANTEWGNVAILRPSWLRGSQQLVLTHQDGVVRSELNCGEHPVWSGPWTHEIRIDGQTLAPPSEWSEVCWHSDDDLDYQEIQACLPNDWVLQRQVIMAREDHFLLMADALLGPCDARIEYCADLPLAAGVKFEPAGETREGFLVGKRRLGTVLPLALPEWRGARADGELTSSDGKLQIRQASQGRRMYVPLFFDLDRMRFQRPLTWRQLTVAERLQIQPASRAVAYRVQIGEEQWLFYRSLAEAVSRTVLGENLSNEFLAARFDRDGDADELIRIDRE